MISAKHEVRCLHVQRRERQRFSGLQKIEVPRVSGSLHSSLGQSKSAFFSGRFLYLEPESKRFCAAIALKSFDAAAIKHGYR
jgi:hypothetical protein